MCEHQPGFLTRDNDASTHHTGHSNCADDVGNCGMQPGPENTYRTPLHNLETERHGNGSK